MCFKAILYYFGLNSLSHLIACGSTELKLVFDLINLSHRSSGKNQFIVGLPWCSTNSKVQILGKSKVWTVRSTSEMHFSIKHDSAPQHLHSHLIQHCLATQKYTLMSQLDDISCRHPRDLQKYSQQMHKVHFKIFNAGMQLLSKELL